MRAHVPLSLIFTTLVSVSCGSDSSFSIVLRDADDIQVLTPEEVSALRAKASVTISDGTTPADEVASPSEGTDDTIPLNQDDRPAELKLFDAFSKFRGCVEDSGETIRGNLQDPNNPAYQDPKYLELIQKCAARSDIVNVLSEVAATRASLTPEQIEDRNVAFKLLSECLKKRGWKIESATDEQGLISPTRFESADGDLDERDINQCLTETGINEAIENSQ